MHLYGARMIFTLPVMDSIGHNFHGSWRHPDARNREFKGFDLWVDLAEKAEKAKVDAFFFTDVMGVQGEYNGKRDVVFEMAQRTPVLAQAGGSPAGLDFASRHAEFMFLSAFSLETSALQVGAVRELARAHGRRDGDILFLQGMMFVIGSTDEEVYRKWGELEEWRSPEAQTAYFSSLSGMDLGRYDPATPLEDILDEIPGIQGAFLAVINAWPDGSKPTIKDFLTSLSLPQMVVGSPETIANRLIEYRGAGVFC